MTDISPDDQTDSTVTDSAIEHEVTESVAFYIEDSHTDSFDGPRRTGVLRSCVRAALKSEGSAAPEHVAHAARSLSQRDNSPPDEAIEAVLREVERIHERNRHIQRFDEPPLEGFPIFEPRKRERERGAEVFTEQDREEM